jgi:hypothetical protein
VVVGRAVGELAFEHEVAVLGLGLAFAFLLLTDILEAQSGVLRLSYMVHLLLLENFCPSLHLTLTSVLPAPLLFFALVVGIFVVFMTLF